MDRLQIIFSSRKKKSQGGGVVSPQKRRKKVNQRNKGDAGMASRDSIIADQLS